MDEQWATDERASSGSIRLLLISAESKLRPQLTDQQLNSQRLVGFGRRLHKVISNKEQNIKKHENKRLYPGSCKFETNHYLVKLIII